jgi:hypothetical protein
MVFIARVRNSGELMEAIILPGIIDFGKVGRLSSNDVHGGELNGRIRN